MAETFVYRGVHGKHPAIAAAREGRVFPANPDGLATAESHNLDRTVADSPYTSWTHDYQVALRQARRQGTGGVILRLPLGAPSPTDIWSWEWSPDEWFENEILLRGERSGATVEFV